jgi:predicted PolB exonuclease-like 3'-5' exonuclease
MLDNTLVFDIETVPDVDAGARLYQLGDLPAEQVVKAMQAIRREKTGGSDFLPLYLHRVVAISIGLRTREEFRIWSLGDEESSEEELVQRFFTGIERYNPVLVSWNGTGFDLPVLHYRSLLGDVSAGGAKGEGRVLRSSRAATRSESAAQRGRPGRRRILFGAGLR